MTTSTVGLIAGLLLAIAIATGGFLGFLHGIFHCTCRTAGKLKNAIFCIRIP